jgi:hypothetical protein
VKDDKTTRGKLDVTLCPPAAVRAAARAFSDGLAKGYRRDSWQHGAPETYLAAAMRHLLALVDGEERASDSGLSHVDHLAACVAILAWHEEQEQRAERSAPVDNTIPILSAEAVLSYHRRMVEANEAADAALAKAKAQAK